MGEAFARLKGEDYEPVPPKEFPDLRLGPGKRAMYGNGWLSLTIPRPLVRSRRAYASARSRKCSRALTGTSSSGIPISHLKRSPGYLFKEVLIDGELCGQATRPT